MKNKISLSCVIIIIIASAIVWSNGRVYIFDFESREKASGIAILKFDKKIDVDMFKMILEKSGTGHTKLIYGDSTPMGKKTQIELQEKLEDGYYVIMSPKNYYLSFEVEDGEPKVVFMTSQ